MRILVLLSLVATTLAGCSSDGGGHQEDAFDDFGDVEVDDDTGIIRGLVIDPFVRPVEGVLVELGETGANVTTNEKGAFLFQGVTPGVHFLRLSKDGYETVQANAEVEAGVKDPKVVRVRLSEIPGLEPRAVPYVWEGLLGCSLRYVIEGRSCPAADQIWSDHDFLTDIKLDAVPTYVTSDMVWRSTQQLGGEMSFNIRRTDTNTDTLDVEGTSPLHLGLNATHIALHGTNNANDNQGGFGPDEGDEMRIIVFTAHLQETEPPVCMPDTPVTNPVCLWGVGAQIDQSFQVYTHIFYNYAPPTEWRFTSDSNVPPP